jgi:hypothetical protein
MKHGLVKGGYVATKFTMLLFMLNAHYKEKLLSPCCATVTSTLLIVIGSGRSIYDSFEFLL